MRLSLSPHPQNSVIAQAKSFQVFELKKIKLAVGDLVRATKNSGACKNNELYRIESIQAHQIELVPGARDRGRAFKISTRHALHIDQGIAVTSHSSQGKTVDQVVVSAPVASFSQVNQAQFYVSMSRARRSMHLFTDSKVALREAIIRPAARRSPLGAMQGVGPTKPPWYQAIAEVVSRTIKAEQRSARTVIER
jgi:hypothetical protein